MVFDFMTRMTLGLCISILPGATPALCPSTAVSIDVTSPTDVRNITDALACTGEGEFSITWYPSVTLAQTIKVSDTKKVTVTGVGFPSLRGALFDDKDTASAVDAEFKSGTGIFSLSNGSTLLLNNLVLEGGSEDVGGGVSVLSSSSLFVFSCTFTNNSASNGGAIYASTSAIYIAGDTLFEDNSAQIGGGIHLYDSSSLQIGGITSFLNNTAYGDGGALYATQGSSVSMDGFTTFSNNVAGNNGGAVALILNTAMSINGNATFVFNAATGHGGALYVSEGSSIDVEGKSIFTHNVAVFNGGALHVSDGSSVKVNGNSTFAYNVAMVDGGAMYLLRSSSIHITCGTSVLYNTAESNGGAMVLSINSSAYINGDTHMSNNKADNGGVVMMTFQSFLSVHGNTSFHHNSVTNTGGVFFSWISQIRIDGRTSAIHNTADAAGGVMFVSESVIGIDGHTTFTHNIANSPGGGVVSASQTDISIAGYTYLAHNKGYDGGVIVAQALKMKITGEVIVWNNSAIRDGGAVMFSVITGVSACSVRPGDNPNPSGAQRCRHPNEHVWCKQPLGEGVQQYKYLQVAQTVCILVVTPPKPCGLRRSVGAFKISDASLAIGNDPQERGVSSTSSLIGGATSNTAESLEMGLIETISFVENTAFGYGGAISLTNPVNVNISNVAFTLNSAGSGGAAAITSSVWAPAELKRCRFESNNATRGGGLHISGEIQTFLKQSSFRRNVAEEMGGALLSAGAIEIEDTVFTENTATDGGLAIQTLESSVTLRNVIFQGNILSCPLQTYSYNQDVSKISADSCRFELACGQCLDGCDSDLSNVTIASMTLPTCQPIPVGVWPSSTAITLQTFDMKEGYYRVSGNSPIVLECYQKDACTGGIHPGNYCAVGYEGPYCAVCTENYAPGSNYRCYKCSRQTKAIAVGLSTIGLAIAFFVAAVVVSDLVQAVRDDADLVHMNQRRWWREHLSPLRKLLLEAIPVSAIRILVVVLQIVVQFSEIAGSVYPAEYEAFLTTMTLVNFDIGSVMSASCLLKTDFYDRLVISTVAPLVALLGCAGCFCIASLKNWNNSTAGPIVKDKHLSVVLFIMFFVYSSVSYTIFQTFVCDPLDDGNAYLRADYSIACNSETHASYLWYASLMVCVYPVGIPAFFAWWLVVNRRDLGKPDRETLPQLQSCRCLWDAYKPSSYYYEVVECGRRIVLTGAAVFVLPDSAEQVAIVLFLAVVFMFISESVSPFEAKTDMWLYRWGNGIILASMYVALFIKVDLAVEETRTSSAITAILIAANVVLILSVAVQAILLMRGLCVSKKTGQTPVSEFPLTRRTV